MGKILAKVLAKFGFHHRKAKASAPQVEALAPQAEELAPQAEAMAPQAEVSAPEAEPLPQRSFRLLDLPIELRELIYEFVLKASRGECGETGLIPYDKCKVPCTCGIKTVDSLNYSLHPHPEVRAKSNPVHRCPSTFVCPLDCPYVGLLQCCHQVSREARSVVRRLHGPHCKHPKRILHINIEGTFIDLGASWKSSLTWPEPVSCSCEDSSLEIQVRFLPQGTIFDLDEWKHQVRVRCVAKHAFHVAFAYLIYGPRMQSCRPLANKTPLEHLAIRLMGEEERKTNLGLNIMERRARALEPLRQMIEDMDEYRAGLIRHMESTEGWNKAPQLVNRWLRTMRLSWHEHFVTADFLDEGLRVFRTEEGDE